MYMTKGICRWKIRTQHFYYCSFLSLTNKTQKQKRNTKYERIEAKYFFIILRHNQDTYF